MFVFLVCDWASPQYAWMRWERAQIQRDPKVFAVSNSKFMQHRFPGFQFHSWLYKNVWLPKKKREEPFAVSTYLKDMLTYENHLTIKLVFNVILHKFNASHSCSQQMLVQIRSNSVEVGGSKVHQAEWWFSEMVNELYVGSALSFGPCWRLSPSWFFDHLWSSLFVFFDVLHLSTSLKQSWGPRIATQYVWTSGSGVSLSWLRKRRLCHQSKRFLWIDWIQN